MTNHVFSEITKFKFKVPITSRSASSSPLQGSPSSQGVTPALDSPFLLLWSQCVDLFWPFPFCQEPPAFPVSTSQIPAFLQFCLWRIGCWGDPAGSWGISDVSVAVLPVGRLTCRRLKHLCSALPLQAWASQITTLARVVLRRAKGSPLSADFFRSTALSIIF